MATIKDFEDLEIWQIAREICNEIQEIADNSKLRTDYKLYGQIDGSSGSAMDNIAEGFERDGNKEFHQFLSISKGSIGETRSQLYRVLDRKYCTEEKFAELKLKCRTLSRKIQSFMSYLRKSEHAGNKFKTND